MAKKQTSKSEPTLFDMEPVCPVIVKGKVKLSRAQTEFNRLNKKVAVLKKEIRELPEREKYIISFYQENAVSLFEKESDLLYDFVCYLDKAYQTAKLSAKDKKILAELIVVECDSIEEFRISEEKQIVLQEIANKYAEISTGLSTEEREIAVVREVLEMFSIIGIKPSAKMKRAKTETELYEATIEKIVSEQKKELKREEKKQERKKEQQKEQQAEEPRRKLTKKELQMKLQEDQSMKSIREIYIELVKELHPDKETDEEVRLVKEERMKRLTEAYQKKDLASLLSMQVDWLEETTLHPATQTDEVLKRYNKVLRMQVERLEEEYELHCMSPFPTVDGGYAKVRHIPLNKLDTELSYLLINQKNSLMSLESEFASVSTLPGLKKYLKDFAGEMEDDLDLDDLFRGLLGI